MTPRRGIASIWALAILAVVSLMTAAILGQSLATRRSLEAHIHRLQAEHLADAGMRVGLLKLKADSKYAGESRRLLKNGEVKIEVVREPGHAPKLVVEARFPLDRPRPVHRRIERSLN